MMGANPKEDLRLDNLISDFALLKAGYAEDRAQRRRMLVLMELIARGMRTPIVVSRPQACAMLGISITTARRDPSRLPAPTKDGKYRVEDILAFVADRPAKREREAV